MRVKRLLRKVWKIFDPPLGGKWRALRNVKVSELLVAQQRDLFDEVNLDIGGEG